MLELFLSDAPAGTVTLTVALSYLLGSIPFGLVLTRFAGLGDIRKIGSGSIGATNVLRTGNRVLAALTMVLDSGKGAAAALIAYGVAPDLAPLAALATVLGHLFPVWLRFQGGKGVATTFGVYLALSWPVGLCAFGIWLAVVFTTRISSLSALIAALLSPVFAWYFADPRVAAVLAILAVLVIIRHKDNIVRLRRGVEPKIGLKRK
jgi:glycerol-3-phosphate acyltransferase PlsY